MRIVLIYSPFAWPSAPPLGVSMLKSYIQSSSASATAEALDLNISFFTQPEKFIETMCGGCSGGCIHRGASPAALIESGVYADAINALKTFSKNFFYPESHMEAYLAFRTFYEKTKICADKIFKNYIEEKGNPSRAESMLAPYGEIILKRAPDIAGFSCHSDQAPWSLALAKWLKKNSGVVTAVGGYFPSFCGAEDVVNSFHFIDYAVCGEGELAIEAIVKGESGDDFATCAGIFKRGAETPSGSRADHPALLDELPPPDFSDFDLHSYFTPAPVLPVLGSRGCRWGRCAFCAHRENYSKTYRERSAKNILAEIQSHKNQYGVRHFLFCDEQISGPRLKELSETLGGENIIFGLAGLKPDKSVAPNHLAVAYDAGCRWTYLGVESLTQRILDSMKKGTSVMNILEVAKNCFDAGIIPFVSYMWGFPGQTKEDVLAESGLIFDASEYLRLPDDGHGFTLEKGSPVSESPEKFSVEVLIPDVMFETDTGKILTGRLNYRALAGLTPTQAMTLYQPPVDVPWEGHSFWECLLLLAERNITLTFDRRTYFEKTLISPEAKTAARLEKMEPLNISRQLDLAHCMFAAGEMRGPMELLTQMAEAADVEGKSDDDGAGHSIYSLLSEIHEAMENSEEALSCAMKAVGAAPNDVLRAMAELRAAQLMEKSSMLEKAAETFEKCAPRLNRTRRAAALKGLGTCLYRLRRFNDSVAALQEARSLDWEGILSLSISFTLAATYDALGRKDDAEEENRRVRIFF